LKRAKGSGLGEELKEAREQQAATAEILKVIASSPDNVQPAFEAIAASAKRLMDGYSAAVFRFIDGLSHLKAFTPTTAEADEALKNTYPMPIANFPLAQQAVLNGDTHQIPDTETSKEFFNVRLARARGFRSIMFTPLMHQRRAIGMIAITRREPSRFAEHHVQLLRTFADQAVIAIENARLFNEVQQRTSDLSESLEQQTATSEVLKVISSSPGALKPVFEAMLAYAVRICGAKFGTLFLCEGDDFRVVAQHNTPPALAELRQREPMLRVGPGTSLYRSKEAKQPIQITDLTAEPIYFERDANRVALVELGGYRAILSVPMVKESEVVGAINMYRQDAGMFSDNQVELVKNFAAQAVIAIENTRLLNELRQSLEQQTATSDVLQIISSSPGDLAPVFEKMLENATRVCGAEFGGMNLIENGLARQVALYNAPAEFAKARIDKVFRPYPQGAMATLIRTKQVVHLPDMRTTPAYLDRSEATVELVELAGARTLAVVPMLREDEVIGAITVYRQEVKPFTVKQIELIANFAKQAVIAIENARLLNELRESYRLVQEQASELETQSQELVKLNQQLEQRVADQVGEIERMSRLRRFLPPQVADLIVASGSEKQLESHRREITALFCDLRGFTGFSEASAPEDVMALLRDYHAAIGEIIIKYSGTLERYAGDGVMVVFNDPVPVDNPALRAVLMALETRGAMGTLMEKWRQLGHDVGFGIGIAHGFATLGTIGFEGRFDYAAIGTVSNIASRLCDEAKPGQILISPRVFTAVRDAVTVEPMGEFTLKGIGRPLATYNVLGAKPAN
jgi:class 3 adenylate cyclase/putative methionine-R-sulfoxide reductase with GAF domain